MDMEKSDLDGYGEDMLATFGSCSRPEWADTPFVGGLRPPVPPPLIPKSPEWGDTDHTASPTPSRCIGTPGLLTQWTAERPQ